MVRNAKEGFDRVLADEDGNFAFIHEASQVNRISFHCIHFWLSQNSSLDNIGY